MDTFSIERKLNELTDEKVKYFFMKKRDELKSCLQRSYKMQLRDDSRLAWTFISVLPESELDHVARELWNTKILYDFTPYSEICKDILPLVKKELIEQRHMDPQKTWEHIQQFVIPYIQVDCMETYIDIKRQIDSN